VGQGAQPGIIVPDSVGAPEALYIAATHGTAAASDDHGHVTTSSFLMLPDGTINTVGAANWGHLAVHETADKVKKLIAAYYGSGPNKSYFQGCSGGGRDAYAAAQVHPEDFDGIVAVAPARSWSKFVTGYLTYDPLISQRDLGGVVPTADQQESVRAAAIRSCDSTLNGHHDGYISDPDQCHYDPTKDAAVLCTSDGGTNTTAACVTKVQAQAFNKAWYGMTVDGSVPDPQNDLGVGRVVAPKQIAPGFARGAPNVLTAAPSFSDFAVVFGNSALARPSFTNATGNGQDAWKNLTYQDLANIVYQSIAMQPYLGLSDADDPRPHQVPGPRRKDDQRARHGRPGYPAQQHRRLLPAIVRSHRRDGEDRSGLPPAVPDPRNEPLRYVLRVTDGSVRADDRAGRGRPDHLSERQRRAGAEAVLRRRRRLGREGNRTARFLHRDQQGEHQQPARVCVSEKDRLCRWRYQ
jgi:hypothetical protein